MQRIYALVDYQNIFGSKFGAVPYRSGMDKDQLKTRFAAAGYDLVFLPFSQIDLRTMDFKDQYVLYTSTEDDAYLYKGYIEDVCYALKLQGAVLIPDYKYLRAHCNKVFMELLRDMLDYDGVKNIRSRHFGCLEELQSSGENVTPPVVVKAARGAKSNYVSLADDRRELLSQAARISRSRNIGQEAWDFGRGLKHKGYLRESRHRRKFITQDFVPGLSCDYKVLCYGSRFYAGRRETRKHDFRASGSGVFELNVEVAEVPEGLFDYCEEVLDRLRVPLVSLDAVFDGTEFYVVEFQAVCPGTAFQVMATHHFQRRDGEWSVVKERRSLEEEYVDCIARFIKQGS